MSKNISVKYEWKKDMKKTNFAKKVKEEDKVSKTSKSTNSYWDLRRQTYYIPEVIIDALQLKKAFENKDISEIVREALIDSIEDKYLNMAKEKYINK